MTFTRRTDEQKMDEKQEFRARSQEFMDQLIQQVEAAKDTESFKEMLRWVGKFHKYSWGNLIMILMQKPEATQVAGYSAWKSMGRFPRAGTGIKIWAPTIRKLVQRDNEGNEQVLSQLAGFHLTTVFDVADTDGDPIPDTRQFYTESSQEGEFLYTALKKAAEGRGITVTEKEMQANGTSMGGAIEIRSDMAMLGKASSMAHEIAHEIRREGEMFEYAVEEMIAESVAFVVCSHFNLDGLLSQNYVAFWGGDREKLTQAMGIIQSVADKIIEAAEEVLHECAN